MYKCPRCGNTEKFAIAASCIMEIKCSDNDYTVTNITDQEWDGNSVMFCLNCRNDDFEYKFEVSEK